MPKLSPHDIPAMRDNMWKPGQSGNPLGAAKHRTFEQIVRDVLREKVDGSDIDQFEVLARVVVEEAIKTRNTQVIKLLVERLWPMTKMINANLTTENPLTASPEAAAIFDSMSPEMIAVVRKAAHIEMMTDGDEQGREELRRLADSLPDGDSKTDSTGNSMETTPR